MHTEEWIDKLMPEIMGSLAECWRCPVGVNTEKGLNLAGQQATHKILDDLISVLFPGCHGHKAAPHDDLERMLHTELTNTAMELKLQTRRAYEYQCTIEPCEECHKCDDKAIDAVSHLIRSFPETQKILQEDIRAAYEGDPAARSTMEVVMSYPGVYAIMVHRIAHLLFEKKVPLIPRIMAEYAHSKTGIDIHPGASIGRGFFIDHGTGVVIGETCTIGERVKLYQGVTLGALSFEKDGQGMPVKGIQRHPTVEDHVVIYGGATILGNVVIGTHSEIGGNVWLTHSIPPNSHVYNQQPKPLVRQANGTWHTEDGPWNDPGAGI